MPVSVMWFAKKKREKGDESTGRAWPPAKGIPLIE